MDIGNLTDNPFFLNLGVWSGIFVLFLLVALAFFFFLKKSFVITGLLCWFIGILLMYNGINFLISSIPLVMGSFLIIGVRSR